MTRLLLVRHAESEWNAARIFQGQQGPGLSERGRTQAEVTAAFLAATEPDTALLAHSDLPRVVETAAATVEALPAVPVVADERLREIDVGHWSGRTLADVQAAYPEAYAAWRRGEDTDDCPGETFAAVRERVAGALADLCAKVPDGTVLAFTHGGPIRVALAIALDLPPGGEARLAPVPNCSISELAYAREVVRLVSYNRTAHLAAVPWG